MKILYFFLFSFLFIACNTPVINKNDVVAEVNGEQILLSELASQSKQEIFDNSGKLLFVPYTKDFGRITQFWGNDLATVLYATFCSDMLSSHSFSKQR